MSRLPLPPAAAVWVRQLRVSTREQRAKLVNSVRRQLGAPALPLPPPGLRFMGEDDARFQRTGDELVADLRQHCGLSPVSRVLDVGSGYGRFAHALLREGDFRGDYLGFDILPRHIGWCRAHLGHAFAPKVRFQHVDVKNERYNPGGRIDATSLVFPVESNSVDAALLASVFTHMYPATVLRYLSELRRVLAPGGAVLASFFLLGLDGNQGDGPDAAYPMRQQLTPYCRYAKTEDPLFAIGYDWAWLRARITELGLTVQAEPKGGQWAGGRPHAERWQDFVVLRRDA